MEIFDGLNSMDWLSFGELPGGFKTEMTDIPPRDKFKYSYDLWSQGLAVNAYTIGRTYKLSMRNRALGQGLWLIHFDSRGRAVNISFTGTQWRGSELGGPARSDDFTTLPYPPGYRPEIHRLIGGGWLKGRWIDHLEDTLLSYRPEVIREDHPFFCAAMDALDSVIQAIRLADEDDIPEKSRGLFRKFRALCPMDSGDLKQYQTQFRKILDLRDEIPVEPPELSREHYHAVPVMVEHGCGGSCTYCNLYSRQIRCLQREDIRRQILAMRDLLGEELDHYRRIVLLEGDALAADTALLTDAMDMARREFAMDGQDPFAHAFARAESVNRKTDGELRALADSGMRHINMGLETGCEDLMRFIKPRQTTEMVRQAFCRLERAGIEVSLNILAGAGGKEFFRRHAEETAEFISSLPGSVEVYFSPLLIYPDAPYYRQVKRFGELSQGELEDQCHYFQQNLGAVHYLFVPI